MRFDAAEAALTLRTVAKIHEDPRGGPVRIIINGRHRKPTGRYTSAKARRAMPWEDRAERMFFWLCEADTAVVSFLAQPHCLEMKVAGGGRSLLYYPDVRRDMADGRVEIREIKSRDAGTRRRDPDYAHKLELAHEVYARLGWDFEHNVGHLYAAKPALAAHYRALDPCNAFNPGIGHTSRNAGWQASPVTQMNPQGEYHVS
jgi:hypothetical protein